MTPDDPIGFIAREVIGYVAGVVLTLSVLFMRRMFKRHDDLEARLIELEKNSVGHQDFRRLETRLASLEKNAVTHEDFRRLETKFDKLTDRINRFLESKNR